MTTTPYNAWRPENKRGGGSAGGRDLVTIPNARTLDESAKGLRCDFGDGAEHWVPKSQIAPQSEVKRGGDRGFLVVPKWWAERACVMRFSRPASPWLALRHTRHRLQELNALLAKDDPARTIIRTICDALRQDLGLTLAGTGGGGDGKGGASAAG